MASSPVSDTNNNQEVGGRFVPKEHDSLQRHVAFFDRNHDGIVYPWETFQGFRAIGCGILLSSFSAIFINFGLSRQTRPNKTRVVHIASATDEYALLLYEVQGKSFSLLFPIEVRNIHKAKHGSDSGVYDSDGRFVPSKFEEIFIKHAHTNGNALTSEELDGLLKANREPNDRRGWLAAWTEWKILYLLCKDKNGLLHKDTIRAVYDGSLFERMEKERSEAAAAAAKKKDIA